MADVDVNEELLDYEDEPETEVADGDNAGDAAATKSEKVKGNYVSIHSSGFRDFLLKPEVLRAIGDCGFEHPSEVQHECIPQVRTFWSLHSSTDICRLSWAWTSSARPSLGWGKLLSSCSPLSSRSSQLMDR